MHKFLFDAAGALLHFICDELRATVPAAHIGEYRAAVAGVVAVPLSPAEAAAEAAKAAAPSLVDTMESLAGGAILTAATGGAVDVAGLAVSAAEALAPAALNAGAAALGAAMS